MVKGNEVRQSLHKHGFGSVKKGSDKSHRFHVTAKHKKHPVKVEIYALAGPPHQSVSVDKHGVVVKVSGEKGSLIKMPGFDQPIVISRLAQIETILETIARRWKSLAA